jgi:ectoine hydroxylase-related dioxygenase (phytanoyl-CoA dioxygenase family)
LGWLDDYRREGFAVLRGVLDPETVAGCLDHLANLAGRGGEGAAVVAATLERDEFLAGTAADPRLTAVASEILGYQAAAFGCTFIVKAPHTGLPVLWHQDGLPWRTRFGITEAVTLWVALDHADVRNGGLAVVPRSHSLAAQPLRPNVESPSVFGLEIDPSLVEEEQAIQLDLGPGDVSAHHPSLIHGSGPNPSPRPRRSLVVRYRPRGETDWRAGAGRSSSAQPARSP